MTGLSLALHHTVGYLGGLAAAHPLAALGIFTGLTGAGRRMQTLRKVMPGWPLALGAVVLVVFCWRKSAPFRAFGWSSLAGLGVLWVRYISDWRQQLTITYLLAATVAVWLCVYLRGKWLSDIPLRRRRRIVTIATREGVKAVHGAETRVLRPTDIPSGSSVRFQMHPGKSVDAAAKGDVEMLGSAINTIARGYGAEEVVHLEVANDHSRPMGHGELRIYAETDALAAGVAGPQLVGFPA